MRTHQEENSVTGHTSGWADLLKHIFSLRDEVNISTELKISLSPRGIFRLPDELLSEIVDYLPVMSRACLSLSCKRFYRLAGSALASDELQLPALFKQSKYDWCAARTWRWIFLGLVEDKRWLRCAACIRLHPIDEFKSCHRDLADEDEKRDKRRTCYSANYIGGVVYLCPCTRITFRDKLQLISRLRASSSNQRTSEMEPWHKCERSYNSARVQVQIEPWLLEDGELVIETKYDIICEGEHSPLKRLPYFCCRDTTLHELVSNTRDTRKRCSFCETDMYYLKTTGDGGKVCYAVRTLRYLGRGGKIADDTWRDQRCKEYDDPHKFRKPLPPQLDSFDIIERVDDLTNSEGGSWY